MESGSSGSVFQDEGEKEAARDSKGDADKGSGDPEQISEEGGNVKVGW